MGLAGVPSQPGSGQEPGADPTRYHPQGIRTNGTDGAPPLQLPHSPDILPQSLDEAFPPLFLPSPRSSPFPHFSSLFAPMLLHTPLPPRPASYPIRISPSLPSPCRLRLPLPVVVFPRPPSPRRPSWLCVMLPPLPPPPAPTFFTMCVGQKTPHSQNIMLSFLEILRPFGFRQILFAKKVPNQPMVLPHCCFYCSCLPPFCKCQPRHHVPDLPILCCPTEPCFFFAFRKDSSMQPIGPH